jgi:hypothetical protein
MRRALIAAFFVLFASFILGATVFREEVSQAAQGILPVRVVNTSAEPVPVSLPAGPVAVSMSAPEMHASSELLSFLGSDLVTVPAGIVVTDVVVSSEDPDCTGVEIGLFNNPGGTAPFVLYRSGEPITELHLETGIESTAGAPLTIQVPGLCVAWVFWSGYEG